MQRLTLPALIVRSPLAVAMVQGVPVDGKHVYKRVERRNYGTDYRGAVVIFGSRNYQTSDAILIGRVIAHQRKHLRPSKDDTREAEVFSVYASAWRYRLVGYVDLQSVTVLADRATAQNMRDDIGAFDLRHEWPASHYWHVAPLAECQDASTPLFNEVCAGCLRTPPHNATASHVRLQTVSLPSALVPANVKKEIQPWPR